MQKLCLFLVLVLLALVTADATAPPRARMTKLFKKAAVQLANRRSRENGASVARHRAAQLQNLRRLRSQRSNHLRQIAYQILQQFPGGAPPPPAQLAALQQEMAQLTLGLHEKSSYDPKLNTGIFQRGPYEPYVRYFPDCVPDFIGNGDYATSNAFNNMGTINPPGNCGPDNKGRLTWYVQFSAIPRDYVIDPATGLDRWPAHIIIDPKTLQAFDTITNQTVPNPDGLPRMPIEGLPHWVQQMVNGTAPWGQKFTRNKKAIDPPRALPNRKAPTIKYGNGAKDEINEYYLAALDWAVSVGFEVVAAVSNPCDYCPFLWDQPNQPSYWGDRGSTSVLTQGRAISDSHFMHHNLAARVNDPHNSFDYQKVDYENQFVVSGHSAGPSADIWNMVGEASAGYAPDPLFAKAYAAWLDPAVELVSKESLQLLNNIMVVLRSSTGNGGASEDMSIELLKWLPGNPDAGLFLFTPGLYHQQIQFWDCPDSLIAQLFDLFPDTHSSSWMQALWYLDTCNADTSTWFVNPSRELQARQMTSREWIYLYMIYARAFGLLPRDDPGFEGQYVAPGRDNADAYLRYILRTKEQRRIRDLYFPGQYIPMNRLDKSGNTPIVSTKPSTVDPSNPDDNYATQIMLQQGAWEHAYSSNSEATSGRSYADNFPAGAGDNEYDTNLWPKIPSNFDGVDNPVAWFSPVTTINVNGVNVRAFQYVEPTFEQLYADPRSQCTPTSC